MLSFFTLAFLIGMQHALEADHVAAVSSMAARQTSVRRIVQSGAVWGLGHTLTLSVFAGAAVILGLAIGDSLAGWLEFAVGVMLMGLGGHVLHRLWRDRVHFHAHRHADAGMHFHAHSHAGERREHARSRHDHDHARAFPVRALLVGMMHGMAGSAALLVLAASTAPTGESGLLYVVVFGSGSILGMAALSLAIAVPLALSARFLTWGNRTLQAATGVATMALGVATVWETQLSHLIG
ncbi:MAG: urease accessory protein [Alphaproteobacteria bacterium]|nr:urease accessory protein [Alphaproteobacteria bacterium]MBF0251315.1 urease accessory protein [Alphaproteobacteria bacterium]